MDTQMNEKEQSRRDVLKKAGRIILPTILTFHISALAVQASTGIDTKRRFSKEPGRPVQKNP